MNLRRGTVRPQRFIEVCCRHAWSLPRSARAVAFVLSVLLVAAVLGESRVVTAFQSKSPPPTVRGPLLDLHVPERRTFELALDEAELDWSADPQAKHRAPGFSAATTARGAVVRQEAARATVALAGVLDASALAAEVSALRAVNPGAAVHLVLYEGRGPRTDATRVLLTTEVAVIMEPGHDPAPLLTSLGAKALRPAGSVPDAFVVDADDPLAAVSLADALRGQPGVRTAYPLLRRLRATR